MAEQRPTPPMPRWTRGEARRYIAEAYSNRVAWVAARVLLERALVHIDPEKPVFTDIQVFLERHPAPGTPEAAQVLDAALEEEPGG